MRHTLLILILFLINHLTFAQELETDTALRHLELLSSDSLRGRETGSDGNLLARDYIIDQFSQQGVAAFFPEYLQNFSFKRGNKKIHGINVVGYVQGKYDPMIIISAHYDHIGTKDSLIFNGADDNASGVAALLELAAYFTHHQPNHTLVFCAFDAEEIGLQGSKAFLESSAVNPTNIVMNINMDMISRSEKGILFAVGTGHYPYLKKFLPIGKSGNFLLATGHDNASKPAENWTYSSDHAPFHRMKIPFIYFGVDDHADYHKPSDTFERIQPEFYRFSIHTILQSILNLDQGLIGKENEE